MVGAGPRPCAGRAARRGGGGAGLRRGGAGPLLHGALQHLLQERLPEAHGGAHLLAGAANLQEATCFDHNFLKPTNFSASQPSWNAE